MRFFARVENGQSVVTTADDAAMESMTTLTNHIAHVLNVPPGGELFLVFGRDHRRALVRRPADLEPKDRLIYEPPDSGSGLLANNKKLPRAKTSKTSVPCTLTELQLRPYQHSITATCPLRALNVSKEAIAFTKPNLIIPLPKSCATTEISSKEVSAEQARDFLNQTRDLSIINESTIQNLLPGMIPDHAIHFYRNFVDEPLISFREKQNNRIAFSRREIDILAYAVLQAERGLKAPGTKNSSTHSAWGKHAWHLMPYRHNQRIIGNKVRVRMEFPHFFGSRIKNEYLNQPSYVEFLDEKVKALFDSMVS